jgi:hypothetical protein
VKRFVSLQFLNSRQSVRLLERGVSPSQGRYLKQTRNKRTQTSIPWVGVEPTIPVFKRGEMIHVFNRAATVIGFISLCLKLIWNLPKQKFLLERFALSLKALQETRKVWIQYCTKTG